MSTLQAPTNERIEVIDVLRGFTLLGIALVHFTEQYYAGQYPTSKVAAFEGTLADQIVSGFIGILVQGKFFAIFSFLFGMSFFIQSSKAKDAGFYLRFAWRLIVLFLIGTVHALHYRGDILQIYAVLGFALLVADFLPDKVLLALALFLVADVPAFASRLVMAIGPADSGIFDQDQTVLEAYYRTVSEGTYKEILLANLNEIIPKFQFQVVFGRLYITLGLFFLGLYAGRKRFFEDWEKNTALTKTILKWAGIFIGILVVLGLLIFVGSEAAGIKLNQMMQFAIGGFLFDLFNAALAVVYVSAIILLFLRPNWRRRLMIFYEPGRMGLTTYLLQTVVGFCIFFSPMAGMLGQYGASVWVLVALFVFSLQIVVSKLWLRSFRYGPVEWLWRSLTYFSVQPMMKKQPN